MAGRGRRNDRRDPRRDREAARRADGRAERHRREREAWDPAPPTDEDWVVGEGSGLRRVTGPEPVGDAVDAFLGRTNWRERVGSTRLLADWEGLVGRDVAAHCRPVRIDQGVLVIAAESHAWATQLAWLEQTLRERVNAAAGQALVRRVRVVVDDAPTPGPEGG